MPREFESELGFWDLDGMFQLSSARLGETGLWLGLELRKWKFSSANRAINAEVSI